MSAFNLPPGVTLSDIEGQQSDECAKCHKIVHPEELDENAECEECAEKRRERALQECDLCHDIVPLARTGLTMTGQILCDRCNN